MTVAVIGLGTIINVLAILIGSAIGVALGHRLPQRTRDVVTDGIGLVVLLVAASSASAVLAAAVSREVGASGVLIVLGSVLIGGIIGSLLRIEERLEGLGEAIRIRTSRHPSSDQPWAVDLDLDGALTDGALTDAAFTDGKGTDTGVAEGGVPGAAPGAWTGPTGTFAEGFVTASLVFCVGPLAVLGALSDGLGLGLEQLALKSVLDGFTAIAFAATLGWGVAASALVVGAYQGTLTLLGWGLGSVLTAAQVALLTATGGLLLVGIALRLLRVRQVPVGDLLPALIVAPILTALVAAVR